MPCFDEAGNLARVVGDLVDHLRALDLEAWEVVVVDDGSTDGSASIADRLAADDDRVRAIHHPRNLGYGAALRSGLRAASLNWVFFTDSDGQFDLDELAGLVDLGRDHDLVVGRRVHRRDHWLRRLNMAAWGSLVNGLFHLGVHDVDCAFKLVRRDHVVAIGPLESDGAFASTELLAKLAHRGVVAHEVAVTHRPRKWGTPTGANPRVIARAFRDLFQLRRRLRQGGAAAK